MMKYIVIISLFIFSAIACRANAFQWKVEKFDIWGRAILVSEDGTHTETPEKSRKKLCAIYHSPDFWDLVSKTIESRDSGGISIVTAIWFDIASGDDRGRIIHDVYAGTVGEIPDRTNPYISKRVFDKVKLISDTNSDSRLIYALSIMLLDYYDFTEILSFFGRGKDDFPSFVYVKLAAMWEYSGVRWNGFGDYSQIIYFFHFLPKMFPEWCLYFDILSRDSRRRLKHLLTRLKDSCCREEKNSPKNARQLGTNQDQRAAIFIYKSLRNGIKKSCRS